MTVGFSDTFLSMSLNPQTTVCNNHLLDYLEGRRERLESSDGEPGAAGDELQELPLLVAAVRGQDLVEHPDGRRVRVEAVVRLARLSQLLRVPSHKVLLNYREIRNGTHVTFLG